MNLNVLVTSRFPLEESAAALDAALSDPTQLKIVIDTASQNSEDNR